MRANVLRYNIYVPISTNLYIYTGIIIYIIVMSANTAQSTVTEQNTII